ncbi:MAG: NlpC/P60 family protein [Candidatus Thiothrix putei]|uniref:NlpC/P60 family protein n=1 Tax=Candidatus Thiothrix putei TaxID=3080811 RepID=A0AA95HDG7_9GAMM|nr:MAG: NlpC/P60 family protein [Candidatus Thiothrix putei]
MWSHNQLAVKYALLGSAVLTMAGCSLNPQVADVSSIPSIQPDKSPKPQATQAVRTPHTVAVKPQRVATRKPKPSSATPSLDKVALCALKQCGKGYCWGGNSPLKGFDCSGLTQYSFGKGASVNIPRTAAAQYEVAMKIPREQAGRGDRV